MSIFVRAIDQMTNHTAADLRAFLADLIVSAGILDVIGGHYAVTENGPDYLFLHLMEPHANSEEYTDSILVRQNHRKLRRMIFRLHGLEHDVPNAAQRIEA